MKTIMLTLSTNDVEIIQRSLLYTAMVFQNESNNQQNSPETLDSFSKTSKKVRDIFADISNQCEKQKEQEDAE